VIEKKNQFKTQHIVHCCSPPDEEEKETQPDEQHRQLIFKVKPVLNYLRIVYQWIYLEPV